MLRFAIMALVILVTVIPSALSQHFRGWYEAGGTFIDDAKLKSFLGESVDGNKIEFDPGFRAGIALGKEVARFVVLELESGFNYNTLKSIGGAAEADSKLYQVPALGNIVLQFPNRTRLVPSVGAGAGAVYSILDAENISIGGTQLTDSDDTWTFAYQGYAALRYQFRPDMALGLSYHYLVNDAPGWKSRAGLVKFDRLVNHSISVSFGFAF